MEGDMDWVLGLESYLKIASFCIIFRDDRITIILIATLVIQMMQDWIRRASGYRLMGLQCSFRTNMDHIYISFSGSMACGYAPIGCPQSSMCETPNRQEMERLPIIRVVELRTKVWKVLLLLRTVEHW